MFAKATRHQTYSVYNVVTIEDISDCHDLCNPKQYILYTDIFGGTTRMPLKSGVNSELQSSCNRV